jgi:hypothetical protein
MNLPLSTLNLQLRLRPRHTRRGTALAETLLALPFLFLITLFIVYFGRSYVWMQRTHIADRYQAWREAAHTPGPGVDHLRGHPQINDAFFGETADAIGHGGSHWFPDDAPARWADAAAMLSDDAGNLARAMRDNMAKGRTAGFSVTHNSSNKVLQQFDGPSAPDTPSRTTTGNTSTASASAAAPGTRPAPTPPTSTPFATSSTKTSTTPSATWATTPSPT